MFCAVATDGHRLALSQMTMPQGANDMPAIILPRKAVVVQIADDQEGDVQSHSQGNRARIFSFGLVHINIKAD